VFHGLSNELPLTLDKYKISGIVTIHDLLFKRYPEYYKATDRFIYDQKTRLACKNAKRIIAISEATKRDIISFYLIPDDRIVVIPPVSSFEIQQMTQGVVSRNNNPPYLLCVSGFENRKNIERLIEAYSRSSMEWQLIIAGKKGDTAIECLRLIDKLRSKFTLIQVI
jgi:glycosyltransferase involved in cell wall biosynthesis